jgi:hypothetical protein
VLGLARIKSLRSSPRDGKLPASFTVLLPVSWILHVISLLIFNQSCRVSRSSELSDRICEVHGKTFSLLIDSESGLGSICSLALAFCERCPGVRACFSHDCHGCTQVHSSRMMPIPQVVTFDGAESPDTVHKACMAGIMPRTQVTERLTLQLWFCRLRVQVWVMGFGGTEDLRLHCLETKRALKEKPDGYNCFWSCSRRTSGLL